MGAQVLGLLLSMLWELVAYLRVCRLLVEDRSWVMCHSIAPGASAAHVTMSWEALETPLELPSEIRVVSGSWVSL